MTVNQLVAGSNPARGAYQSLIREKRVRLLFYPDVLKGQYVVCLYITY